MSAVEPTSLFPSAEESAPVVNGPFAGVVLEQSVDRVLDYSIPKSLLTTLLVGQRVKVPLGRNNRPTRGYVVSIHPTTTYPKVKDVLAIEDDRVLVDAKMMELARWMSRYYVAPLGIVIESVLPSAVKKMTGMGYSSQVRLAVAREKIQELLEKTKAPKRRAIFARLLQLEPDAPIEINRLAEEAGATVPTVRKLSRAGLITIRAEVDLPSLTADLADSAGDEPDRELNEDQRAVCDTLAPRVAAGGFSVNLLHGVTGSGKTEVYLHCIRQAVDNGKQAIVLVPEIALTPQTVRRFTKRFKRVAILHSGLTATQRHRYWQQIAEGRADVIVGARSAVFAPTPRLGVIVVDEEHESSYKQDTAPRYHGRDVAIKRAQLEGVAVILGSATPALETYHRARSEQQRESKMEDGGSKDSPSSILHPPSSLSLPPPSLYHYYRLPRRVRGLAMPHVELVDMRNEQRMRRGIHLISQRLEYLLRNTLDTGHQAILLLNRRGYSNFVYCSSCQHLMTCKYCDKTMTYHRSSGAHVKVPTTEQGVHAGQLHCHYCLAVNPLPATCPACAHKLSLFGLGTQRVEEEITRKFPDLKFARVDSDSMHSAGDYEKLLERFGSGEIKVMLGTQMISKGLDYPNVTLVGVISGDTALGLPDFRASERTFQMITQVAGRAGRGDAPGRVVLQTFIPDDPTITSALNQDYDGFAARELKSRQEVKLPPFARMVRIILRDADPDKVALLGDELAGEITAVIGKLNAPVHLRGPMPCAIGRIAGYLRQQILLQSPKASALQAVLAEVRRLGSLAKSDRIAVDVDPVSLL